MQKILLPGGDEQLAFLTESINLENKDILVAGPNLAPAAEELSELTAKSVEFILPDYESLMNANLYFTKKNIIPKMMEFEITDYDAESFDVIFAQASVSTSERKKIIKEFKRILKPGGIICVGEIIIKNREIPEFASEILERSDLDAKTIDEIRHFYSERNFNILKEKDLSETLKEFYTNVRKRYMAISEDLDEHEKSYYKKLMKKASHEANAFLDFGAGKYIGFYAMILKLG